MNCYETLFVVKPTLTEEETAAEIAKIKDVLAKVEAELLATDDMGMRRLAYPVQKNDRGYYTVLFYKANGDAIAEIERNLKINEEVIKFLTVKYVKNKEIAQFDKLVAAAGKKAEAPAPEAPAPEAKAEETTEA
ncbi:30S ribosomal protein S6 [Sulfurovum sp.]|uniref:30S ribosomal protein S6 n=1 Tax=Sulfurovum sp. TaxID=1969726 RepID=UPI0025F07A0F|nr:30S ribosomal protein S6 [Sulfurovum sp.]